MLIFKKTLFFSLIITTLAANNLESKPFATMIKSLEFCGFKPNQPTNYAKQLEMIKSPVYKKAMKNLEESRQRHNEIIAKKMAAVKKLY